MWWSRVNKDVEPLIKFFLPKTEPVTRAALTTVCRHFHLAMKGMDADEVYEVLMMQLLKAIHRYDPSYTEKVRLLTEAINTITHDAPTKRFNVTDFSDHLEFDCYRHLRVLARNSFIEPVLEDGEPAGWVIRSDNWPPPKSFHRVGPIGLTYYLQTWFRYNLQQYISDRMSELEATEQVYSLEGLHKVPSRRYDTQHASSAAKKEFTADALTVISNAWLARDRSLASSIDVTKLDLSWVNETDDALFAALSRTERQLLYLVFAREMPWKDVAESFDMGPERLSGGMSACSPRLNRELHRQ